ncbi:2Fe-2S iron-sulfur cluster binding domain-containing protein [Paraburkholderia sp. 1N]|uniref:2Fe-2S iron-sulfur cluster binding domain-containing protein n=1 Tax=Paraburkholderia solitsugae TaxID=2675748 RepID=A0ABX2BJN3_9BURK|nr:(2Fe-2S)-binding protein [Paraburkholderia solitsugae]NPT41162.1 2Fe-2S iron-sulfur cluster binding domain-containing protein [Paraburkholderia solitsugae]
MQFELNGRSFSFDGESDTPLLWVIREHAKLTGTKYGCGIGACGACTVHLEGEAVRSCVMPVSAVAGKSIRTIEALSPDGAHPVQRAWLAKDVPQCGYCQSGMVMAAAALLVQHPKPTDAQIDQSITNLCRCATYQRIREAIHVAAEH